MTLFALTTGAHIAYIVLVVCCLIFGFAFGVRFAWRAYDSLSRDYARLEQELETLRRQVLRS